MARAQGRCAPPKSAGKPIPYGPRPGLLKEKAATVDKPPRAKKEISFLGNLQIICRSIPKGPPPHFGQRSDPAPGPSDNRELVKELTTQDTRIYDSSLLIRVSKMLFYRSHNGSPKADRFVTLKIHSRSIYSRGPAAEFFCNPRVNLHLWQCPRASAVQKSA